MVAKIKDEVTGVAIKEFAILKPNMHSFLVVHINENKKAKGANKNVVATISNN